MVVLEPISLLKPDTSRGETNDLKQGFKIRTPQCWTQMVINSSNKKL